MEVAPLLPGLQRNTSSAFKPDDFYVAPDGPSYIPLYLPREELSSKTPQGVEMTMPPACMRTNTCCQGVLPLGWSFRMQGKNLNLFRV